MRQKRASAVVRSVFAGTLAAGFIICSIPIWIRHLQSRDIQAGMPLRMAWVAANGLFLRLQGVGVCNRCVKLLDSEQLMLPSDVRLPMSEEAQRMADFAGFCATNGVRFAYVQLPKKLDTAKEMLPPGVSDVAYDNADDLLRHLRASGVETEDWRTLFAGTPQQVKENFYASDTHWNNRAARRAAREMTCLIARMCGLHEPAAQKAAQLLEDNQWQSEIFARHFSGALARRTGPFFAPPDDVLAVWPRFDTCLSLEVPQHQLATTGTCLEICFPAYGRWRSGRTDGRGTFSAQYGGGSAKLIRLKNPSAPLDVCLLIIGDSFSRSLRSHLAVAVKEIVSVDPRQYDQPLNMAELVRTERPDLVVQTHTAASLTADTAAGHLKRNRPASFDYGL